MSRPPNVVRMGNHNQIGTVYETKATQRMDEELNNPRAMHVISAVERKPLVVLIEDIEWETNYSEKQRGISRSSSLFLRIR